MIEMTTKILQIIIVCTYMNDCGGSLTKAHMFVLLREYSGKILFPLLILLFPQTAISYFLKFNVTYFGKCGRYYCF